MGDTALIHEELQALGITPNYKGYQQAVCAIQLALEEESRLRNVTKEIYWVVADAMGVPAPTLSGTCARCPSGLGG